MLRRVAELLGAAAPFRERNEARDGLHRFCPMVPNSDVQRRFVLDDAFILAMLGGTGGGKTFGMVGSALRFADRPGYKALIIRRTHPALAAPDGPIWTAEEMLAGVPGAEYSATNKRWIFKHPKAAPAVLQFASCQHDDDVMRLMGPSWDFIGIDEVVEFPTAKVWSTLLTRFRRKVNSTIPPRLRATGNPGGPGQRWVVDELVKKELHVHSTYRDNPAIDRDDYAEKLAMLPETMRAWYEEGDFDARPTGLVYPLHKATLFGGISFLPNPGDDGWDFVVGHDPGTSAYRPSLAFSLVAWNAHEPRKVYVLRGLKLGGEGDIERAIDKGAGQLRAFLDDHPKALIVVDPGAFGEDFVNAYRTRYRIPCEIAQKSPGYKRTAQLVVRGMIERGEIYVVDGQETVQLREEADALIWAEDGLNEAPGLPNHCCDAFLYAVMRTPAYHDAKLRPQVRSAEAEADWQMAERKRRLLEPESKGSVWVKQ